MTNVQKFAQVSLLKFGNVTKGLCVKEAVTAKESNCCTLINTRYELEVRLSSTWLDTRSLEPLNIASCRKDIRHSYTIN